MSVQDYIEGIPAEFRPLFDRLQRLILAVRPDATVVMAYNMPTYKTEGHRIHLAAWKHGVSIYGWKKEDDGGFVARHPELKTSTGTLQIRPADAGHITDQEFLDLFRPAL